MDVWQQFRQYDLEQREAQQSAFQKLREKKKSIPAKSPIEVIFLEVWRQTYPTIELIAQYKVLKYRLDFAHVETMTAIEIDGHATHHKRRDRTKDYQRQRRIEDMGWRFIRFTGSEIYGDVESCVQIAWERIQQGRQG